jgi:hypothetical protein
LVVVLGAGLLLADSGFRTAAADPPLKTPGEGVMCALGIYTYLEQVGAQCFPGQDPALQTELHRSVAELDRFVLANGWTPADLTRFKAEQARVGQPKEKVCLAEWLPLYGASRRSGTEKLRASVLGLVARPGRPTWGDCL